MAVEITERTVIAEVAEDAELVELTVSGAAALAGVSERTIRNWINAGELAARSEPSGRKIRKAYFLDLLERKGYAPPPVETPELVVEAVVAAATVTTEATETAERLAETLAAAEGVVAKATAGMETSEALHAEPSAATETTSLILQSLVEQLNAERARTNQLHRENLELAGRIGFLQAKLMETEQKLLTAIAEPPEPPENAAAETAEDPEGRRPWWKKLLSLP